MPVGRRGRATVKLTVPKLVSGSGVQLETVPSHADGASAIHSALEMSGLLIVSVLATDLTGGLVCHRDVTAVPLTVTRLVMWSPGCDGEARA